MTTLSIIVPTYNEVESLPFLVDRIHESLSGYDYELVVVDDNSPDGTGELAEEFARQKPIKVLHRSGKLGLASAVIEGFQQASGDIVGVIDADLQHPPEHIPQMLEAMDQSDIAIASRYIPGGGTEGWTFLREFISHGARIIPQFMFARIRSIKDPLSGFFLVRKKVIDGVSLNPIGYKILLEILIKGNHNSVVEVPYIFKGRERGTSNFNISEQVNYLKHLYRLIQTERETERFIKFCMVGASGVVVNMGMYWLLTRPGSITDIIAEPISIEISILTNFTLNEIWTFSDRRVGGLGSAILRTLKFNLVCGAGAVLNFGMFYLLTRVMDLFDMIALLIAIIVAVMFNFVMNKWWTWK